MFAARFNSKCNRCYGTIAAGEMITGTPQRTYVHVICPVETPKSCSCCSQQMTHRVTATESLRVMGDRSYAGLVECGYCRPFGPGAVCCDN